MAKQDYYEVLGVDKSSDEQAIKKAYKRLAMKYHPDRNPDNKEALDKFKEIQEAYEILSNPEKKEQYDQYGHSAFEQGGGGFNHGFDDAFSDIFSSFFGRGGQQRQQQQARGADLRYNVQITLEEAIKGTSKKISFEAPCQCEKCQGKGTNEKSKTEKCTHCNGLGQIRTQQGFFVSQKTCPHCRGRGTIITNPCKSCHGDGIVNKKRTLSVKIPVGSDSGQQMILRGQGAAGPNGAPNGDLYIVIYVKDHDIFTRDGSNLYCEVPISFTLAALGGDIEVPTIDGKIKLKVPAETQSGRMMRLRGKGINVAGYLAGDLICKLIVETPVGLNPKQKELLTQLEESLTGKKNTPKSSSFIDSIKSFFHKMDQK